MEGPVVKRAKLLTPLATGDDWTNWYKSLGLLEERLLTGCLCRIETIQLHRPILSALLELDLKVSSINFSLDYTLLFISTVKLLCELAVSQRGVGFICSKVSEIATSVSTDEEIWETLLQLLSSSDKFVSYSSSKCLTSLLLWTRVPHVSQIFDVLLDSVVTIVGNPLQVAHSLEVIRSIIEHNDEDEHPLQLLGSGLHGNCNPKPQCTKIEVDSDNCDIEVKDISIKALESWWTRLVTKFKSLMSNYEDQYEYSIITFLSLWQAIVSVKSNLDVVDTKHFYLQVESFVSHLNSALPPVLWKKLLDVFNEILCYGSTLSLQDSLPEEPCNLAHLILRCVKSRQFLQGVPFNRSFSSFGGTCWIQADDSKWESELPSCQEGSAFGNSIESMMNQRLSYIPVKPLVYEEALPSSSNRTSLFGSSGQAPLHTQGIQPRTISSNIPKIPLATIGEKLVAESNSSTIYIGPTPFAVVSTEEKEDLESGDMPLLQKVVLLILKCVAVTVRETKEEGDSSDEEEEPEEAGGGQRSPTDSDFNDMVIIERSVREVFEHVDTYIKSILPYHPATPICQWIVKLFSDQDDALVEAMLCALDSFTSFIGRIDITTDFYQQLNPVTTFMSFAETISEDKAVIVDLLIGNETCFLLYLLRLLKYISKNWEKFRTTCGRDLEKIIGLFIRLKMSLVNSPHFPYNIDPIIRLLEVCENSYESSSNNLIS